jgi:hypothetical protein
MSVIGSAGIKSVGGGGTAWTTILLGTMTGSAAVINAEDDIDHETYGGSSAYNDAPYMEEVQFTYQLLTGDFDVKCRIPEIPDAWNTNDSNAGLMAKNAIDGSQCIGIMTSLWYRKTEDNWAAAERMKRTVVDGSLSIQFDEVAANNWIRLKRVGTIFSTYYGTNGTSWTTLDISDNLSGSNSDMYVGVFSNPTDSGFVEGAFDISFLDIDGF